VPDEKIDTTTRRVTLRTRRGNLYVGPHGRIDGLWRLCARELRTTYQVRVMCGNPTRHTLLAWRRRERDPFPAPVLTLKEGDRPVELWSRTEVEGWLERRAAALAAIDPLA
jgi:hypothetical protein